MNREAFTNRLAFEHYLKQLTAEKHFRMEIRQLLLQSYCFTLAVNIKIKPYFLLLNIVS